MARKKKRRGCGTVIALFAVILLAAIAVTGVLSLLRRYEAEQEKSAYPLPEEYAAIIAENARTYDIPLPVLYAVIRTESHFDPGALSGAGAVGMMQIMPVTFAWLQPKLHETLTDDALYDPSVNIRYGSYLLHMLYEEFGNWETVWAAYNAGINRVRGWLRDPQYGADGKLIAIPIAETEQYVKKVRTAAEKYRELYFPADGGTPEDTF